MPQLRGTNLQYYRYEHLKVAETGSQFETQIAVANAHGPFEFDYGVCYLHYVAHYVFDGALADRNTGFLPYATFAVRLGHR